MRAVVLLSGGLDSATCLALARREGFECHALTFDYGQRHKAEIECARRIAGQLGAASHTEYSLDVGPFAGSSLTTDDDVPKDTAEPGTGDIPSTYVPARNLVFLSIATAFAETLDAGDVFIGVNAVDYSGYPDCRPDFVDAFARAATLATPAWHAGSQPADGADAAVAVEQGRDRARGAGRGRGFCAHDLVL